MNKFLFKRISLYVIGNLFLAAGFIFNAKSSLGISPINVIAYCMSVITGTTFSDMTMCLFVFAFFAALLIRMKKPRLVEFLQLPYCFLFSRVMSAISAIIPAPDSTALKIVFLILGFMCVGTGATLTLNMNLIPNPVDFMMNALSNKIKKPLGLTKNIIDVAMVAITFVIGLLSGLSVIESGIGIGTLVAMIFTGRWIALVNHFFLDRFKQIKNSIIIKIFDENNDLEVI